MEYGVAGGGKDRPGSMTVAEVAREIESDRSAAMKRIRRGGIAVTMVPRATNSGVQSMAVVSRADAERIIERCRAACRPLG